MVSEKDRFFWLLLATRIIEIKYLKDKNKLVRIITNSRIEKYMIYFLSSVSFYEKIKLWYIFFELAKQGLIRGNKIWKDTLFLLFSLKPSEIIWVGKKLG